MKKLLLSLLLASAALAAPKPGGNMGVALTPVNNLAFLHVDNLGRLLLSGAGPGLGMITPGGNVGIALDPDNLYAFLHVDASGGLIVSPTGLPTGTVTSVSVVTANGFSGSVATATTTPAITISQTSIGSAVTATTQTAGDNSTKVATTAYADRQTPMVQLVSKNVTILTAGTPADIATISIPAWVTRWQIGASSSMIAESAAGTLAGASISIYDTAAGGGNLVSAAANCPAAATGNGSRVAIANSNPTSSQSWSTSSTIYIRQTANSANAGTVSFYIWISVMN